MNHLRTNIAQLQRRSKVLKRYLKLRLRPHFSRANQTLHNTPLMSILFAMSTSMLMYQNCSPTQPASESGTNSLAVYSSTIGGPSGGGTSGGGSGGSGGGSYAPGVGTPATGMPGSGGGGTGGGAIPIGGGGTGGGGTGGGMPGGGSGGGGVPGGGGTIPVDPGSGGGGGGVGMPGGGNSGVNPGGSTGGPTAPTFLWNAQPEDRTVEEGEVLTLGAYASKGIDLVTYQWYKNGQSIAGQTGYMLRMFLTPLSAAGQYYVVARSGSETIQSVTITVKVKAARNPCAAGKWGIYPGTNNYNEYWHESMIGSNATIQLQRELPDAYTVRMPYQNPNTVGFGNCIAASGLFQCRNGKLISADEVRCDQYYESPGGI